MKWKRDQSNNGEEAKQIAVLVEKTVDQSGIENAVATYINEETSPVIIIASVNDLYYDNETQEGFINVSAQLWIGDEVEYENDDMTLVGGASMDYRPDTNSVGDCRVSTIRSSYHLELLRDFIDLIIELKSQIESIGAENEVQNTAR